MSVITFEPKSHTYKDENGLEYISVTTLLSREFPFDSERIASEVIKYRSSEYHGSSVDRVLEEWKNSSLHGNVVHEAVEDYITYGRWPEDETLTPLVEQFSKLNFKGKLLSEVLLHDEELRIAGTADILEVFSDHIYLFDIKTSKKVNDDKLMKFSLQLELYRRMIAKQFNKETRLGAIVWYEDYVKKRQKTKLKLLQPLHLGDVVDEILQKRKEELTCQSQSNSKS